MSISTDTTDNYAIITIDDDKLGGLLAPDLKANFVQLGADGTRNVIVNLENARYCDSSGLSALLVGNRLCADVGGTFVLCCLNDMVMKLIQISQLESVLNITPTKQEAIDFIMMDEVGRELDNE
ncbi:MAG: STAS domain-containing protein [Flavobacteriales bacterium]|jgi:anti-anti-sigma factor|nr:STAS domain-containing protein [Flavobacteriales bacterium]NCG29365.1 anti-sigma factor antagonist [Bacteroidota bacterium]MBT3963793.1 STAS domain-containing protein [Flavobacteriales bacterium]MBT4705426.1 STAS domain-containing protein [Flavobacteriales bacterium]MBT4929823.1 STAS domain-containing protein [Flavobacteriales bacterium]